MVLKSKTGSCKGKSTTRYHVSFCIFSCIRFTMRTYRQQVPMPKRCTCTRPSVDGNWKCACRRRLAHHPKTHTASARPAPTFCSCFDKTMLPCAPCQKDPARTPNLRPMYVSLTHKRSLISSAYAGTMSKKMTKKTRFVRIDAIRKTKQRIPMQTKKYANVDMKAALVDPSQGFSGSGEYAAVAL